jgi:uncharacterized protein
MKALLMILTQDSNPAKNQIQRYNDTSITINNVIYHKSLIVSANTLFTDWPVRSIDDLTEENLHQLTIENPEIILIGTGPTATILRDALLAPLFSKNLSVECMSNGAACRTFAALCAENRHVVAGIILEG